MEEGGSFQRVPGHLLGLCEKTCIGQGDEAGGTTFCFDLNKPCAYRNGINKVIWKGPSVNSWTTEQKGVRAARGTLHRVEGSGFCMFPTQ